LNGFLHILWFVLLYVKYLGANQIISFPSYKLLWNGVSCKVWHNKQKQ